MAPFSPRRTLGAGLVAALGLAPAVALAQPAPAPPPPPASFAGPAPAAEPAAAPSGGEPLRFTFDLHGGLLFRLGSLTPEPDSRGGGLLGFNALLGTNKWYQVGLGYEHAFLGNNRSDDGKGTFSTTSHTLDDLWFLGRVYPWQNEHVALFVQLGLGPTFQSLSSSGDTTRIVGASPQLMPTSCSAHASAGLGLRGAVGVDVALSSLIIFTADAGFDHYRTPGGLVDKCGNGIGPSTFLATRFGFALATGRQKPPPPPAPPPPPSDRDGDGILDNVDACPDQAGLPNEDPNKNGCPPPPDRDHDGVPDVADACPDLAGPPNDDPKKNGCPDRDGDKIIDPEDACPDIPGVASPKAEDNGCPADSDGDGIRDDKDACPSEKGLPNEDPKKNGCPLVAVRADEVTIGEQVQFDNDKATIKAASDKLLDTIAEVLKAHPELIKIQIQGHTDNVGSKSHNKLLSQQRAGSVKKALVKRGVSDKVLLTQGFGEEQPLGDNATEAGRAQNRRVQFKILEKKDPNAAAEPKKLPAKAPKAPKAPGKAPAKAPAKKK